ncbi:hypothetical protein EB061_00415 [bacterium]|jgi:hypothetical protein|nr:hypothetical protein [bacterium]
MNGLISTLGWSSARLVYSASAVSSVVFSLSSGFLAGYNLDLTPQKQFIHGLALAVVEQMEQQSNQANWYQPPVPGVPESSQPEPLFVDASVGIHKQAPDALANIQQEASREEIQMTFSSSLSSEEQNRLKELLILEQWKRNGSRPVTAQRPHTAQAPVRPVSGKAAQALSKNGDGDCSLTSGVRYLRTGADSSSDPAAQALCPKEITWHSRSWEGRGWVTARVEGYRPTLFHLSGAVASEVLLLDEADTGNLEIRSGRRVQEGMGIIAGLLPEGYQVRFAGSSDQAQTFPRGKQKYFAILNVEPGAGVIELVSETDPQWSATVFVPVLENTATYLDLSTTDNRDLRVKVVKNGGEQDPEVAGLTVGLSTHSGIQGITQSDGTAILKGVNLVRGYPVFVDVSSRWGGTRSYTYRFELRERDSAGVYIVREIPGETMDHWLSQVSEGLSPQSALVIGTVDRRKIDGFKFDYRIGVKSLNPQSGLEPSTYSVLWDDRISAEDPLEGDQPRFLSVQVPEGLGQIQLLNEVDAPLKSDLFPVSPRVIHVISP